MKVKHAAYVIHGNSLTKVKLLAENRGKTVAETVNDLISDAYLSFRLTNKHKNSHIKFVT